MKGRIAPREIVGSGLAYAVLSLLYLRLSPAKFISAVGPDHGDPLFNLAILRWGAERATHGFSDFWNPTFFFPLRGVLALSDHLTGPALLAALLAAVGFTPAAVYNGLLLVAFAGSALAAHWVLRRSGLSPAGAAFGAVAWSFSGLRWGSLSHLQVLFALFVPLTLWSFHRFLAEPTGRAALGFGLCYAAQMSGGSYLAYMVHLPLAIVAATALASGDRAAFAGRLPRVALVAAWSAAVSALFFVPYLTLGKGLGLRPRLAEIEEHLVTVGDLFTVGPRTLYSPLLPAELVGDSGLWPGLLLVVLGVAGLATFLARRGVLARKNLALTAAAIGAAALALVAFDLVLAANGAAGREALRSLRFSARWTIAVVLLATALVARLWRPRGQSVAKASDAAVRWWWSLLLVGAGCLLVSHASFFVILRSNVPGMEAIRVPGRFLVFATFALAAFAGLAFDRLAGSPRARRAAAVVFVLLLVEQTPRPEYLRWDPVAAPADLPAGYRFLADDPGVRAVVELPMRETWREAERMYFWSIHRRPLVNGYSAYLPRAYLELRRQLLDFPERDEVERLARLGVTHLVVHLDELSHVQRRRWRAWQTALDRSAEPALRRIREEGPAMIYAVSSPAPATR